MGPTSRHAFNYTTPLVDGDDLLVVSRTSGRWTAAVTQGTHFCPSCGR